MISDDGKVDRFVDIIKRKVYEYSTELGENYKERDLKTEEEKEIYGIFSI